MEGIVHKTISVNGLNIHIAEKGEGPLVLFVHGFPELWYSWRHQIVYLADRGYRAVAPDLRGYGDTTGAPVNDLTKFTIYHLVGDMVGLLDAITSEGEKVFVVGHDWGAFIAWHLCLFRPDRVKALVNLSVPFFPWNPMGDVIGLMKAAYGEDHYMVRFQVPGEIEAELAGMDAKTVSVSHIGTTQILMGLYMLESPLSPQGLFWRDNHRAPHIFTWYQSQVTYIYIVKKFLTFREPGPIYFPKGKGFKHSPGDAPVTLPAWLSEEDVEYFASKLEKTGISGGVNYYRVSRLNWEVSAVWSGAKVVVPSKFITGELDLVYHMPGIKDYIHSGGFQKDVPNLEEVVVMEGAAHFINQEKPDEINNHILDFFQKF